MSQRYRAVLTLYACPILSKLVAFKRRRPARWFFHRCSPMTSHAGVIGSCRCTMFANQQNVSEIFPKTSEASNIFEKSKEYIKRSCGPKQLKTMVAMTVLGLGWIRGEATWLLVWAITKAIWRHFQGSTASFKANKLQPFLAATTGISLIGDPNILILKQAYIYCGVFALYWSISESRQNRVIGCLQQLILVTLMRIEPRRRNILPGHRTNCWNEGMELLTTYVH